MSHSGRDVLDIEAVSSVSATLVQRSQPWDRCAGMILFSIWFKKTWQGLRSKFPYFRWEKTPTKWFYQSLSWHISSLVSLSIWNKNKQYVSCSFQLIFIDHNDNSIVWFKTKNVYCLKKPQLSFDMKWKNAQPKNRNCHWN